MFQMAANLFEVEYHHGGCFVDVPTLSYIGGTVSCEGGVDEDETSLIELTASMRALGYGGSFKFFCKMHDKGLSDGLMLLQTDSDVYQAFVEHRYCKRVVFYVEHSIDAV